MIPCHPQRLLLAAALGCCALMALGCAGLGLPRIDPSGERVFIWPRNQVAAVAPASANLQALPVFTDPVFPQSAQGVSPTVAAQAAGLLPPLPQDRLSITPDRVLAPVGSEVILKAGLCTRENFLLTDSQVDWLVARDGAGELVSLGGRGWSKNPWLPWNKPKKIDNQYATGYTARVPLLITRGTADLSDDVQVEPGEAWASVTSPVEGTSRITAVAPEIATWANRRATATIYWVDVQWTFPPAETSAGGSQVLTTTVRRQTDGTPIEGWLVRYEVAAGTGTLRGDEVGQVVEVATDASGRASIDVTPTGSSGSTTQINTQIVRPERFGGSDAPRLVIARGATRVAWTDGGSDYVPRPDNLDGPTPTYPIPGEETSPPRNNANEPTPAPPIPRRAAVLELEVYAKVQTEVGEQVRFEVVVRNTGESTATGVVLNDSYDAGLAFSNDPQRTLEIRKSLNDIAAGETYSEFLTFDVRETGELCQTFTVSYNQGASTQKKACIQSRSPQLQPQGKLEVIKQGPRQRNVGEQALFTLSIKNVGLAPLTNIEVVDTYDRELQPQASPEAAIRNGSLFWKIARLEVGETWRRDVDCQCLAPKLEACGTLSVTADTGTSVGAISQSERACLEIRPGRDVAPDLGPAPGGNVFPEVSPSPNMDSPLDNASVPGRLNMEMLLFANPVRAGTQTTFQIAIVNNAITSDQRVQLRVLFPPELIPDVPAIKTNARVEAQFKNGELLFAPIAELRATERVSFAIPCNANQPGVRMVTAELISQNMPQGIQDSKQINILGR